MTVAVGPLRVEIHAPTRMALRWESELIRSISSLPGVSVHLVLQSSSIASQADPVARIWNALERLLLRSAMDPFDSDRFLEGKAAVPEGDRQGGAVVPDVVLELGRPGAQPRDAIDPRFGTWRLGARWPFGVEESGSVLYQMRRGASLLHFAIGVTAGGRNRDRPIRVAANRYSFYRTRVRALWKAVRQVALDIRSMTRSEFELERLPAAHEPKPGRIGLSTGAQLGAAWQIGRRSLLRGLQKATAEDEWRVAIRRRGRSSEDFRLVDEVRGRYLADPFLWKHHGRHFLFCEEFVAAAAKGRIVCLEMTEGGGVGARRPVLEEPYHLSYPCLFQQGQQLFMVPESARNRTVDLYRCLEFPQRWQKVCTLLSDIRAVDSTVLQHDGLLWLFTTIYPLHSDFGEELHLYFSADAAGPWQPHPMNPIQTDPRFARCGGQFLKKEGQILRVAQDGTGRYGRRIFLRQLVRLGITEYEERTVDKIGAAWMKDSTGTHTLAMDDEFEVVDVAMRSSRLAPGFSQRGRSVQRAACADE